jgi:hypothetical protein
MGRTGFLRQQMKNRGRLTAAEKAGDQIGSGHSFLQDKCNVVTVAQKPADEKWAVLVNEFGEVGIDGALMADSGALLSRSSYRCRESR